MPSKKEILKLTLIALNYRYGKQYNIVFDENITDEEIIDCKLALCSLLLADDEIEQSKKSKEFKEKFIKLSKEKREYIREYIKNTFGFDIKNYAVDSGYLTLDIKKYFIDNNIFAVFGYRRYGTQESRKEKSKYIYIKDEDYYMNK